MSLNSHYEIAVLLVFILFCTFWEISAFRRTKNERERQRQRQRQTDRQTDKRQRREQKQRREKKLRGRETQTHRKGVSKRLSGLHKAAPWSGCSSASVFVTPSERLTPVNAFLSPPAGQHRPREGRLRLLVFRRNYT